MAVSVVVKRCARPSHSTGSSLPRRLASGLIICLVRVKRLCHQGLHTDNTIAGRAGLLETLGLTTLPNGAPLLLPTEMANQDPDLLRMLLLPHVGRIDLDLAPDDLAIGHFGITNGRRPGDDVTDLTFHLTRQSPCTMAATIRSVPC